MSLVEIINSVQWFSGCILLILAAYGFKYREEEIARGLIGFLLLASFWCFCTAFQLHPKELDVKIFVNRIKMLAVLPITFTILKMSLSYLEPTSKLRQLLKHLWLIPLIFMIIMVSPWHELIITDYSINPENGLLHFKSGSLFGLYIFFARLMGLIAFYLFWTAIKSKNAIYKKSIALIIIAVLIPFIVDWVIVNLVPSLRPLQLVPVAFMLTGLILIYAILFQHVLDFVPLARSKIIEDLSSPCLMWSREGVLVDCNESAVKTLGIAADKKSMKAEVEEGLKINNHDMVIDKKTYRVMYKEILSSTGISSGGYTILSDITESKDSERDLIRINKLKTDVLAVMSHDMGGLLGLLSLNAEVLSVNFEMLDDDYKKTLAQKISEQAREVSRFSTDLMDWSKDQFTQSSFSKQDVNLGQTLFYVINEVKSLAEIKNQKIIYQTEGEEKIFSNPKLIEIIIRNLVLNAIKHGEKDSKITISIDKRNKEIKVTNRGVFSDYEKLNLFFLNQEKNIYSGLGLKICKEFCEILDCWIEYEVTNNSTTASIKGIS
ncbi:MAG: ATP-binding protein [Proteobacteria bacterium]|jgi:two-component sensor histidine kinase|nr:ATP-binding protein [Pseudomonadota bacterium]